MKVAGRKNDGAWFRANKFLASVDEATRDNIATQINASAFLDEAYNALSALADELFVNIDDIDTKEAWTLKLVSNGIPRQIWNGRLSYTTYTKLTTGPRAGQYQANYQSAFHYFAKDLRKIMTRAILGIREINDLTNQGALGNQNPGGLPDANKED